MDDQEKHGIYCQFATIQRKIRGKDKETNNFVNQMALSCIAIP